MSESNRPRSRGQAGDAAISPIDLLLGRLSRVKESGKGYEASCPAPTHGKGRGDRNPSLSISEGDDRRVLIHCKAGCKPDAILAAVDLSWQQLAPNHGNGSPRPARPAQVFPTLEAAIASVATRLGPPSRTWEYVNVNGDVGGAVARWETPDGKQIYPFRRTAKGWQLAGMAAPRPLYRVGDIAAAKRVYICEGEKAADVLRELGMVAITSAGGSEAAAQSDWRPCAGKECIILPDNDSAGERYAAAVSELLGHLNPQPTGKIVRLPGLPEAGDAVEFIAARRKAGLSDAAIRAEIEQLANDAEPVEWDAEPRAEWRPFPVDALPESIRRFIVNAAKAIGCDPAYLALPVLAVCGSAIGNSRRIRLRRTWTEPPLVWAAIVGDSGTQKTPALDLALKPMRAIQSDAFARFEQELADYEARKLVYEKQLSDWKKTKKDIPQPIKPVPPVPARFIVSDTTVEALAPILRHTPRGVLLVRDELAGWIGSFDRYASGTADESNWLSMFSGQPITVDRKTSGLIHVPRALVSIIGGIQPAILDRLVGVQHRESGLLARILLAMPPKRAKRWNDADLSEADEGRYADLVAALLKLQPDADEKPRALKLSPEAYAVWVRFYNEHGNEQAELTGDLAAAWSKLEGYAARLALIVHCIRAAAGHVADPDVIDAKSIEAGVTLSRWFANEARRVYATLGESAEDRERRRLIELIRAKGGAITARELQRSSRMFKKAADADEALNGLVADNLGRWEILRTGGRDTRQFWLADTADADTSTDDGAADGGSVNVNAVSAPPATAPGAGLLWGIGNGHNTDWATKA